MWRYFWAYQTDLPPGSGFDPFSPQHLSWIFPAIGAIVILAVLYHRQRPAVRRKFEIILAVLLALTYILRWIWALSIRHFQANEMLPLQLCAIASFIEIAAVFSKKPLLKEFGYACGLPGGIIVFLTPGIGPYPVLHFYYLLFIIEHTILILLPLIWIISDGFRPDYRRLLPCFGIVVALAGLDNLVNRWIGGNYMFLDYVPENTFWAPIAAWIGNFVYPFAMAGMLILVWVMFYTPWAISARRKAVKQPPSYW